MFSIFSPNAGAVVATWELRVRRAHTFSAPLTRAGVLAVDAAKRRFTSGIWAPNAPSTILRKGSSQPGIDTGRMRSSISASDPTETSILIGTNVKGKNGFLYPMAFQYGTGSRGFRVGARSRLQAAMLVHYGSSAGQPPRPFLLFDKPLIDSIQRLFVKWLRATE